MAKATIDRDGTGLSLSLPALGQEGQSLRIGRKTGNAQVSAFTEVLVCPLPISYPSVLRPARLSGARPGGRAWKVRLLRDEARSLALVGGDAGPVDVALATSEHAQESVTEQGR